MNPDNQTFKANENPLTDLLPTQAKEAISPVSEEENKEPTPSDPISKLFQEKAEQDRIALRARDFLTKIKTRNYQDDEDMLQEECYQTEEAIWGLRTTKGNQWNGGVPFKSAKEHASALEKMITKGYSSIAPDGYTEFVEAKANGASREELAKLAGVPTTEPLLTGSSMGYSSQPATPVARSEEDIDEDIAKYEAHLYARNFMNVYKTLRPELGDTAIGIIDRAAQSGEGLRAEDRDAFLSLSPDEQAKVKVLVDMSRKNQEAFFNDMLLSIKNVSVQLGEGVALFVKDAMLPSDTMDKLTREARSRILAGEEPLSEDERNLIKSESEGFKGNIPTVWGSVPRYGNEGSALDSIARTHALRNYKAELLASRKARDAMRHDELVIRMLSGRKLYTGYSYGEEAIMGVVTTLPYMAVASLPYVGIPIVAMQQFEAVKDRLIMEGENPTTYSDTASAVQFALATSWAMVERLQRLTAFGKPLTSVGYKSLLENTAIPMMRRLSTLGKNITKETLAATIAESTEEGIQGGIEKGTISAFKGSEWHKVIEDASRGVSDDFVQSLGTMGIISLVGTGRKLHRARTGQFDAEAVLDFGARQIQVQNIVTDSQRAVSDPSATPKLAARREARGKELMQKVMTIWRGSESRAEARNSIEDMLGLDEDTTRMLCEWLAERDTILDNLGKNRNLLGAELQAAYGTNNILEAVYLHGQSADGNWDLVKKFFTDYYRGKGLNEEEAIKQASRQVELEKDMASKGITFRSPSSVFTDGSLLDPISFLRTFVNPDLALEEVETEIDGQTMKGNAVVIPIKKKDGTTENYRLMTVVKPDEDVDINSDGFITDIVNLKAIMIDENGAPMLKNKKAIPITRYNWQKLSDAQKKEQIDRHGWKVQGGFRFVAPNGKNISVNGLLTLFSEGGEYTAKSRNKDTLHEIAHAVVRFAREAGAIGKEEAEVMRSLFGKAINAGEEWNEEAMADAFRDYLQGKFDFGKIQDEYRGIVKAAFEAIRQFVLNLLRSIGVNIGATEQERRSAVDAVWEGIMSGDFSKLREYSGVRFKDEGGELQEQEREDSGTRFSMTPAGVQKQANTNYPDAADEIRSLPDTRFSIGKKAREEAKALILKKRPDLAMKRDTSRSLDDMLLGESDPYVERDEEETSRIVEGIVDEIGKFNTPKEQKAALHWFIKGSVRLPEDAPKVTEALQYADRAKGKANTDAMSYTSPMEMIEALHAFKPKAKPINPDTVPELSDKQEMGNGVTTYLVQDDRQGQQAMRQIINTHWGEDANPWCLLHGDGKGNLSDGLNGSYDAWHYWKHYSALPKRVAFKDGKLLAFMATDQEAEDWEYADLVEYWDERREHFNMTYDTEFEDPPTMREYYELNDEEMPVVAEQWWDRKDSAHDGIPLGNMPVPNDPFGRWANYEIRDGKAKQIGGFIKGTRGEDGYREWNADGRLYAFTVGRMTARFGGNNAGEAMFVEYDGHSYLWPTLRSEEGASVKAEAERIYRELTQKSGARFSISSPEAVRHRELYNRYLNGDDAALEEARQLVRERAAKTMPNTKVVGEDGLPKVVYHYTDKDKKFNVFDPLQYPYGWSEEEAQEAIPDLTDGELSDGTYPDWAYTGSFFSEHPRPKDEDSISRKIPAFLNLKNPLIVDYKGVYFNEGTETIVDGNQEWFGYPDDIAMFIREHNLDYDGVICLNVKDGFKVVDDDGHTTYIDHQYIALEPSQIKSADPFTFDDSGNLISLDERFDESKNDIRFSLSPSQTGYEYSYEYLTSLPDMNIPYINDKKQYRGDNRERKNKARESIIKAGGWVDGSQYKMLIGGDEVIIGARGILHSWHNEYNDLIYPILGDVLKNAIRINELNTREEFTREGDKDDQVIAKYIYLGVARDEKSIYPVRIQIDQKKGRMEIGEINVLKSVNTKKEEDAQTGISSLGSSTSLTSSSQISISQLLRIAQPLHPQIFSQDVANALGVGYKGDEIDARFSISPQMAERYKKAKEEIVSLGNELNTSGAGYVSDEGEIRLSIAQYNRIGREKLIAYLNNPKNNVDPQERERILTSLDGMSRLMESMRGDYARFSKWQDVDVEYDKKTGKPYFKVVVQNAEYTMNFDFSTVCVRRRPLDKLLNRLAQEKNGILEQTPLLTRKMIAKIQEDVIKRHGFDVACALCFVDTKRYTVDYFARRFAKMWNTLLDEFEASPKSKEGKNWKTRLKTVLDKESRNRKNQQLDEKRDAEIEAYVAKRKSAGESKKSIEASAEYKAFKQKAKEKYKHPRSESFSNEENMVRLINSSPEERNRIAAKELISSWGQENVVKNRIGLFGIWRQTGAGRPKDSVADHSWNNEIIDPVKDLVTDTAVEFDPTLAFGIGGVRIQSFSDYVPTMVFDYMQMIAELAAKGLPMHTYTKEEYFVRIFGHTGIKMNMSLVPAVAVNLETHERLLGKDGNPIPAGLDENGDYIWVDESFPTTGEHSAFLLRKNYGGNVGAIAVGVSDEHITKLLRDGNIDMVIPYHASGINSEIAWLRNIAGYEDYTDSQHEHYSKWKLDTNGEYMRDENGNLVPSRWGKWSGKQYGAKGKSGESAPPKLKEFPNLYGFLKQAEEMGAQDIPRTAARLFREFCYKNDLIPRFNQFKGEENYYKLLTDFRLYDNEGNYAPLQAVQFNFGGNENQTCGDDVLSAIHASLAQYETEQGEYDAALPEMIDEAKQIIISLKDEAEDEWAKEEAKVSEALDASASKGREENERYTLIGRDDVVNASDYAKAFVATSVLQGRDVSVQEVSKLLKGLRLPVNEAEQVLTDAKSLASSNAAVIKEEIKANDPDLLQSMAKMAMTERFNKAMISAMVGGARAADPVIGEHLERMRQRQLNRALDAAHGYTQAEMRSELYVNLSAALFKVAEYEKSPEEKARLEAAKAKREEERKKAEERGEAFDEADVLQLFDENGNLRDVVDPSEDRKQVPEDVKKLLDAIMAGAQKREERRKKREAEKAKEKEEKAKKKKEKESTLPVGETENDSQGDTSEGSPEAVDVNFGEENIDEETFDLLKPVFTSPDHFASFLEEWVFRRLKRKNPALQGAKCFKDPVNLRELQNTAKNILHTLAKDTLGLSHAFVVAERQIDKVLDYKYLSHVHNHIAYVYGRIHENALRINRTKLINDLIEEMNKKVGSKGRFSYTQEEMSRKAFAKTVEWVKWLTPYLTMSDAKLEEEKNKLEKYIDAYVTPTEDGEWKASNDLTYYEYTTKYSLLMQYGGMKRWLVGDIINASNEILTALDGNIQEFLLRKEMQKERHQKLRTALIEAMEDGYKYVKKTDKKSNVKKILDALDDEMGNIELRLNNLIMFCRDKDKTERAKKAIEDIMVLLSVGSDKYNMSVGKGRREVNTILERCYGRADAGIAHLQEALPEEVERKIFTQGGHTRHTYGNLLQLYGSCIQEDYHDNVITHGRDVQIQDMKDALTPADLMFHKELIQWYKNNRLELSNAVEAITGLPVRSPDANYIPVAVRNIAEGFTPKVSVWNPITASMSKRIRHGLDFDENADILLMIDKAIQDRSQIIGYGEVGISLRDTLAHRDVQDAGKRYAEEGMMKSVIDQVTDVLTQVRPDSGKVSPVVNTLRSYLAVAYLAWNVISGAKQLASIPVWLNVAEVSGKDLLRYLTNVDMQAVDELIATDGYKSRYEIGWTPETRELLRDPNPNAFKKFLQKGMMVSGAFDSLASLWVGQGLYRDLTQKFTKELNEDGTALYTLEEAKARAAAIVWNKVAQTQQTGRREFLNKKQRTNALASLFYQFMTAPLLQLNYELNALKTVVRTGGEKGKKELATAIVVNHVLVPALMQLIQVAFQAIGIAWSPDDEDEWMKLIRNELIGSMILGAFSPLLTTSLIITGLFSEATGERQRAPQAIPAVGAIAHVVDASKLVVKAAGLGATELGIADFSDISVDDVLKDLNKVLRNSFAPYKQADNMSKKWAGEPLIGD